MALTARRRRAHALRWLFAVVAVLASAPIWAPAAGLGARALPPAGTSIELPAGYRVNVLDEGAGRPVVLVHGLPGSAYDWGPLPARLVAAGFRVIRYDRVGYGHSDARRLDEEHRLDRNGSELVQMIVRLGLDSPVLVGWSYGGGVALRAAEDAPTRIGGLLLLGSVGPSSRMGGSGIVAQIAQWPRRWAVASGFPARIGVTLFGTVAFSGAAPEGWTEHALAVLASRGTVHAWSMEASYTDPSSLHPERVPVPATLVHGANDRLSPLSIAVDLHRRLQASRLVEVAGGSHMLPITHAGLVVQHVRHLASSGSGSTAPGAPR